ncbi:MAG: helix-turn-helix domain-containing protein [Lachnospiraceae bacterium]
MDQFIGKKIRDLRKSLGLTQTDLAESIGIARTTLIGYENQTSQPDIETLKRLASFFSVTTDYLLGLENLELNNDDFIKELLYLGKQLNTLNRAVIRGKMAELIKEQQQQGEEKNIG